MILVLAIALIFAAFINILALRRRTKRLQIFDKIETKNLSLSALVESQLAQQKQTFWQKWCLIQSKPLNHILIC